MRNTDRLRSHHSCCYCSSHWRWWQWRIVSWRSVRPTCRYCHRPQRQWVVSSAKFWPARLLFVCGETSKRRYPQNSWSPIIINYYPSHHFSLICQTSTTVQILSAAIPFRLHVVAAIKSPDLHRYPLSVVIPSTLSPAFHITPHTPPPPYTSHPSLKLGHNLSISLKGRGDLFILWRPLCDSWYYWLLFPCVMFLFWCLYLLLGMNQLFIFLCMCVFLLIYVFIFLFWTLKNGWVAWHSHSQSISSISSLCRWQQPKQLPKWTSVV